MSLFDTQEFVIQYQPIDFYGLDIAFVELGQGNQTLLFVHGMGHTHLSWVKNLPELAQKYRCIAIDLPGYGHSMDNAACAYGMQCYAEVLAHFIKERDLGKVTLVGHSMGGQVALTFALKYPQMLHKLVLCASAGFEVFQPWEKAMYRNALLFMDLVTDEEKSLKQVLENSFYHHMPQGAQEYLQKLVNLMRQKDKKRYRKIIEQSIAGMLDEPVFERLNEINLPVLLLFGNQDGFIPNRMIHPVTTQSIAEEAVKKLPDAQLTIIPFCGHFLQWEKAPNVNAAIQEFLE